jgi:hypothetical protein
VDEIDELVAWAREHAPLPLPLSGWDQASIWGWDKTTGSLYAHLWRNTDDPANPPTIRIGPDQYTPVITWPETLAQHIAMAAECDPWSVIARMDQVVREQGGGASWYDEGNGIAATSGGTVVTMIEKCSLPEWPYRP